MNVESALAIVASDPNYTYTLADPSQPTNTAATVKVGAAEIQILEAAVSAVRSVTNLSLAYNADPGTFDFNAVIPQTEFSGSSLTTSQYLPASPFLTLSSDGGTRMAAVGTELNNVAVDGIAAIETVKTRSNSGYLLDPGTLISTSQLNSAETQIRSVQAYLTGPQSFTLSVNGTHPTVQINLPRVHRPSARRSEDAAARVDNHHRRQRRHLPDPRGVPGYHVRRPLSRRPAD